MLSYSRKAKVTFLNRVTWVLFSPYFNTFRQFVIKLNDNKTQILASKIFKSRKKKFSLKDKSWVPRKHWFLGNRPGGALFPVMTMLVLIHSSWAAKIRRCFNRWRKTIRKGGSLSLFPSSTAAWNQSCTSNWITTNFELSASFPFQGLFSVLGLLLHLLYSIYCR